jgi:hypothetical protein
MPRYLDRQESGPESRDSLFGEGVPLNGADRQADRRSHMRTQTMARQAAEWRLGHPPVPHGCSDRPARLAVRAAELNQELALINAAHQTWLHNRGEES